MKVLVTGAGGFIGSHLTELLVREGYDVRAMVIYDSLDSRGWLGSVAPEVQSSIDVVAGDLRDPNFVRASMKGCEGVLNLAALIAIPYSYVAPESYVQTNVLGTLNVVQAAHDLGLNKVVHVSTSEVYGTAQFVPITEEHPLVGQSPYAATKIGADQIALSYLALVRHAGGGGAAVQHLRAAPVGARRDPDHHHPDRGRQPQIWLGALHPDAGLQLCRAIRRRVCWRRCAARGRSAR